MTTLYGGWRRFRLALASDLQDLRQRVGRVIVAEDYNGERQEGFGRFDMTVRVDETKRDIVVSRFDAVPRVA